MMFNLQKISIQIFIHYFQQIADIEEDEFILRTLLMCLKEDVLK